MDDNSWSGDQLTVENGRTSYQLFVRDVGPRNDTALLFLHGFPTSSLDWRKIAPRLSGMRAIYVDLLGFGHSDKPKIRYSYPLHADLLLKLLADLKLRSVSIIAHDFAVTLAQELLCREQANATGDLAIERVIFLNGSVYSKLHRQVRSHRLLLTPVIGGLAARRLTAKSLAAGLNGIAGKPDAWSVDDARDHLEAMAFNGGLGLLPRLLHYIADRRIDGAVWESAMEKAVKKIGFVWGPADPVSGEHVLAEVRKRMPSAPAISLSGVGHYPQWEAPQKTADAVLRMLNGL